MPTVSVIMPIYNAGNYLTKCLDSLVRQTLSDIEIICVDDCSTDNSYRIIEQYMCKDNRIQYFRNEQNLKQGLTRNVGLNAATGIYVAFVDSDDFVDIDMYERLYNSACINNSDIVGCFLQYHYLEGRDEHIIPFAKTEQALLVPYMLKRTIGETTDRDDWNSYNPTSPCDKLFRREFLNKHKIRFYDNHQVLFEDLVFNFECLLNNPTLNFECFFPYHYLRRVASTSTNVYQNFFDRIFNQYFIMKEMIIHQPDYDTLAQYVDNNMYRALTEVLLCNELVIVQQAKKSFIGKLRALRNYYCKLNTDDRVKRFFKEANYNTQNFGIPFSKKNDILLYTMISRFIFRYMLCTSLFVLGLLSCTVNNEPDLEPVLQFKVGVFGGSVSSRSESQVGRKIWADSISVVVFESKGVDNAGFSSLTSDVCIYNQIANAKVYDIYILWASSNDAVKSVQVDNDDLLDPKTQNGGIRRAVKLIKEENPDALILFFTSLPRWGELNSKVYEYSIAQREVCEQLNISCLFQYDLGFFDVNNQNQFYYPDGAHLTEAGYAKVAPLQGSFIKKHVADYLSSFNKK